MVRPRWTPVQRIYKRHAAIYDWTRWAFLFGRRRAASLLPERPGGRFLEIGCGTGLNFKLLARRHGPEGRIVGLDFSMEMLAKAAGKRARLGMAGIDLVRADAEGLPFRRGFDGILFAYSLTMIPDWERALRQAHDLLAPGGRLVVLDFSTFAGFGPLAAPIRFWLRLHHVATGEPYVEAMKELFKEVEVFRMLGSGYFIAAGSIG